MAIETCEALPFCEKAFKTHVDFAKINRGDYHCI